jgi:hypothetical protein
MKFAVASLLLLCLLGAALSANDKAVYIGTEMYFSLEDALLAVAFQEEATLVLVGNFTDEPSRMIDGLIAPGKLTLIGGEKSHTLVSSNMFFEGTKILNLFHLRFDGIHDAEATAIEGCFSGQLTAANLVFANFAKPAVNTCGTEGLVFINNEFFNSKLPAIDFLNDSPVFVRNNKVHPEQVHSAWNVKLN